MWLIMIFEVLPKKVGHSVAIQFASIIPRGREIRILPVLLQAVLHSSIPRDDVWTELALISQAG